MTDRIAYSVREAAAKLGVSREFLYAKVNSREWPHSKFGNRIKISAADIEEILAMTKVKPVPARVTRNRKAS